MLIPWPFDWTIFGVFTVAFVIGILCAARARSPRHRFWSVPLAFLLSAFSVSLAIFLCFWVADGGGADLRRLAYILPTLIYLAAPAACAAGIYFIHRPVLRRVALVATAAAFMASPSVLMTILVRAQDPGHPELRVEAVARANEEAFKRYGARPFTEKDGMASRHHDLWIWRARGDFGRSNLLATYTYSLHNQASTIQVSQSPGQ